MTTTTNNNALQTIDIDQLQHVCGGGQSLAEALARGYAPSDDMRQPNTEEALRNLPSALYGGVKSAVRGLADVTAGQTKDALNGQGAPIIPPGL